MRQGILPGVGDVSRQLLMELVVEDPLRKVMYGYAFCIRLYTCDVEFATEYVHSRPHALKRNSLGLHIEG